MPGPSLEKRPETLLCSGRAFKIQKKIFTSLSLCRACSYLGPFYLPPRPCDPLSPEVNTTHCLSLSLVLFKCHPFHKPSLPVQSQTGLDFLSLSLYYFFPWHLLLSNTPHTYQFTFFPLFYPLECKFHEDKNWSLDWPLAPNWHAIHKYISHK